MGKNERWLPVLAVMLILTGCSKAPTAPTNNESYSVNGAVLLVQNDGIEAGGNVEVRLAGDGLDLVVPVDDQGNFVFPDVPDGDYLSTPVLDGYTFDPPARELTVAGGDAEAGLYYGGVLHDGENIIAGQAVDSRGVALSDISVVLHLDSGNKTVATDSDGYFVFSGDDKTPIVEGQTYRLSAGRAGQEFRGMSTTGYSLEPDSCYVTVDSRINICGFYSDEPLYTLSTHIVDINGIDMEGVVIYLRSSGSGFSRTTFQQKLGPGGFFEMKGLPSGSYQFYFPSSLLISSPYRFVSSNNTRGGQVAIDSTDVEAEDISTYYIGSTYYHLNGRVVDSSGAGIQGVIVEVEGLFFPLANDITDEEGNYRCLIKVYSGFTESLDVSFQKQGFFFNPAGFNAGKAPWVDGQRDGDDIYSPPVVGYDQERYDAGLYFPLAVGNSWTYHRTDGGNPQEDPEVEITGTNQVDNTVWMSTSIFGPGDYRDYRLVGNDIHALDRNGDDLLILQFGHQKGDEWLIKRETNLYDHIGAYLGTETITVPRGEYTDCEVFSISVVYGKSSEETTTMWFGRGVGLVKMVKVITSNGEVVEERTDELVSYSLQ